MGLTKDTASTKPKANKAKKSSPKGATTGKTTNGPKGNTADIVRSYLYSMCQVDINSVPEDDVLYQTGYSRRDSTGYRKVMKELINELEHVVRQSGKLSLTAKGAAYQEQHGPQMDMTPPNMEDHQAMLMQKVLDNPKAPEKAVRAIWNVLLDGKAHETSALLEASGYSRADSTGYRETMKQLKKLKLLEKGGPKSSWIFTEAVYKFGSRP